VSPQSRSQPGGQPPGGSRSGQRRGAAPPNALFAELLRAARELLAVRSPLDAELMVSELLGTWWGQRGGGRRAATVEQLVGEGLVDYAGEQRSPAALALLSGIACLGTSRQAAKAERVEEHLPGIGDDGPKVTVRFNPLPEEGVLFKEQFDTALRDELGEQRANLLTQLAEGWFNDQFNRFGTEPKTISVSRHPNGTYGFAVKTGDGLGSSDGLPRIDNYLIPPHLRPLFSDVLNPSDSADPTGPPEN